jgi:RNA polymerase subunit RPABC4/transcription elongation factor Spt4
VALIECGNCGAKISANAEVCPKCGGKKEIDTACWECGELLPDNHEGQCPECGTPSPLSSVRSHNDGMPEVESDKLQKEAAIGNVKKEDNAEHRGQRERNLKRLAELKDDFYIKYPPTFMDYLRCFAFSILYSIGPFMFIIILIDAKEKGISRFVNDLSELGEVVTVALIFSLIFAPCSTAKVYIQDRRKVKKLGAEIASLENALGIKEKY